MKYKFKSGKIVAQIRKKSEGLASDQKILTNIMYLWYPKHIFFKIVIKKFQNETQGPHVWNYEPTCIFTIQMVTM